MKYVKNTATISEMVKEVEKDDGSIISEKSVASFIEKVGIKQAAKGSYNIIEFLLARKEAIVQLKKKEEDASISASAMTISNSKIKKTLVEIEILEAKRDEIKLIAKKRKNAVVHRQNQRLTPRQEAFCVEYILHGNASRAYRAVYSWKGMKPSTVNRRAKDLMYKGNIAARVAELQKPAAEAAGITLEGHLKDLKDLRDGAKSFDQYGSAITAEVARGRACGLYVEKREITNKNPVEVTFKSPDKK